MKDKDLFGYGYISLWRILMDESFYKKSEHLHLWVHLLLRANYKDKEILVDGEAMLIKRGQFLTSRKKLSSETGIHESKAERILKFLENEQHIEQQATNKYRIITVLNYEKYQNPERPSEQQGEQQPNSNRTADEQQPNTNKKDNNGNKGLKTHGQTNLSQEFKKFWNLYPKKLHEEKAEKTYLRIAEREGSEKLYRALVGYMNFKQDEAHRKGRDPDPDYFKNAENFLEEGVWKDYVDYEKASLPL